MDGEDEHFWSLSEEFADKDSEISAHQLKRVLNGLLSKRTDMKFDGFNINTCREMISLLDGDGTGSLRPVEFKTLWLKICKYLVTTSGERRASLWAQAPSLPPDPL